MEGGAEERFYGQKIERVGERGRGGGWTYLHHTPGNLPITIRVHIARSGLVLSDSSQLVALSGDGTGTTTFGATCWDT
jgi:hypothetical protein